MNLKEMPIEAIENMLDALPLDISFVDAEDTVKYFNTPKEGRIFPRTKLDLGRKVQKCHPPKSVHVVENILNGFKNNTKKDANFWIQFHDKMVYIQYFPVRDASGKYLGTIEVTQNISEIQKLKGERRILDEE